MTREPPHPYGYQLAHMLYRGREAEAKKLLDALNTVQRGFGCPEYVMPEPLETMFAEVEHLGPGRIAA